MKVTKVEYGKNLMLKGMPVIFNNSGAKLIIGDNCVIKSNFITNLVGLYSRTIIITRTPEAEIHIGNNVGISGATLYARKRITIEIILILVEM
jgi:acetyltransferase-like isoleucine patch superfamily enzyme